MDRLRSTQVSHVKCQACEIWLMHEFLRRAPLGDLRRALQRESSYGRR